MTKIEIVLSEHKPAFIAGETIEGKVKIYSKRNLKCKDVHIICRGQLAKAVHDDEQEYINFLYDKKNLYLKDESNNGILVGGKWHEFVFVHRIPDGTPPSIEISTRDYVRYWLKVVVTRTLCNIKSDTLKCTIVNQLDFERCSNFDQSSSNQVVKTLGGSCRSAVGDVTAKLWTERGCFIPGDNIQCFYTVQNSLPRRITSASLKLLMEQKYLSYGTKWQPFGNKELLSTSLECLKVAEESFSGSGVITVPQVLPTYVSHRILQNRYYIQLSLGISGNRSPLEVKVQVGIGTNHKRGHKFCPMD